MKDWFATLQPRERNVLVAGAAAALAIVLYAFVWQPLTGGSDDLRASIESKERMLANLYRVRALAQDQQGAPVRPDQALVVLVNQTLQASGLIGTLTGTRQDGANISVSFQNAPFDRLLGWLISLERNEGVFVEGASFNTARQRGFITGQLLLSRRS